MEKKVGLIIAVAAAALLLAALSVAGFLLNRRSMERMKAELDSALMGQAEVLAPISDYIEAQMAVDSASKGYASAVQIYAPAVPDEMTFAGQKIKLNRTDLRERMERELITFTYSHSNSIQMLKRSGRYFPMVEPILKAKGVPDDLKYLMAIESNVNPIAVSKAGAAGLWQFMAATAKDYGLEVNANVDERFNIERETEAACDYLLKAYAKYGDWMTVAASYNAGQGGISSRIEKQKQRTAFNLWLPEETSRYMFRILTAKMMFENPSSFGFNLSEEDYYKYVPPRRTVTVTETIKDLPDFAAANGVSYFQLRSANLWLRELSLKVSGKNSYKIKIPRE